MLQLTDKCSTIFLFNHFYVGPNIRCVWGGVKFLDKMLTDRINETVVKTKQQ